MISVKDILAALERVATLTRATDENREQIKELQREVKDLSRQLQVIAFELQREKENSAHEREILTLRLENALLRVGRELPPAAQSEGTKDAPAGG